MELKEIFALIETWEADKIALAIAALKGDKAADAAVSNRYSSMRRVLGASLRALADLPAKWDKLRADKRAEIAANYPSDIPFFTDVLQLNGDLRVDAWRDSHYKYQIKTLSDNVGKLRNLRELHLRHQCLPSLPENIGDLVNLEVLDLTDNKLRSLPASLQNLKKLRILRLEQNYGLQNGFDFGTLEALEEIDFTYTDISTLSDGFYALKNLRRIITTNSDLDKNTDELRKIKRLLPNVELVTYAARALEIEEDADADKYKGLEKIVIDEFNLNALPKSLFLADKVKELHIKSAQLKELPDSFDSLKHLEYLEIRWADVTSLPPSLCRLPNLKILKFEHCRLHTLPDNFGELKALEELELSGYFAELPASFADLKNLRKLKISCNALHGISAQIAGLTSLEKLFIEDLAPNAEGFYPLNCSWHGLTNLKEFYSKSRAVWTNEIMELLPPTLERVQLRFDVYRGDFHPLSLARACNHFKNARFLDLQGKLDLSGEDVPLEINESLRELWLHGCKLPAFPPDIANLKALMGIFFLSCGMVEFGAQLYDCANLEYFRITAPAFRSIPDGIERLHKLRAFGFENHNVAELPEGVFLLPALEKLCWDKAPAPYKAKLKRKYKGLKIVKNWYD